MHSFKKFHSFSFIEIDGRRRMSATYFFSVSDMIVANVNTIGTMRSATDSSSVHESSQRNIFR